MTEHAIKRAIFAYFKRVSDAFGERFLARKQHGSQYSTRGEPDIIGCFDGIAFAIEIKRPGESPTPLQSARLREWHKAGAIMFVARSVEDVRREFAHHFRKRDLHHIADWFDYDSAI